MAISNTNGFFARSFGACSSLPAASASRESAPLVERALRGQVRQEVQGLAAVLLDPPPQEGIGGFGAARGECRGFKGFGRRGHRITPFGSGDGASCSSCA